MEGDGKSEYGALAQLVARNVRNVEVRGSNPLCSTLMLRYQEVITTTDTYHETKSKFAWIGEIENERLLSALENLSEDDLKLLTLYAYEGYNESEISKVFNISQPAIHKRIMKITIFLKKF